MTPEPQTAWFLTDIENREEGRMTRDEVKSALTHFKDHYPSWLEDLKKFVAIPGVSFEGFDGAHLRSAAEFGLKIMNQSGLENVRLLEVEGAPPYLYGDWLHAPGKPTVVLYAHYDVQPPMREEKWRTKAFSATEIRGRLFGRGTADDKAGVLLHAASLAAYLKSSERLPVNVRMIIDGEEEVGSPNLHKLLKKYASRMKGDLLVLADMTNFDTGIPTLTVSLRGLVSFDVEVSVLKNPLHSGMWGGPIPDPITVLSKIIAGLQDEKGKILIPEFYQMIRPLNREEERLLRELPQNHPLFCRQAGLVKGASLLCSRKENLWKKLWREPSLVVNSVESGGKKLSGNVIMDKAWARIGVRTVPGMDSKSVASLLKAKIRSLCPDYVNLSINPLASTESWATDVTHPWFKIASEALRKGYGKKTVFAGCGGSIPFTGIFSKALGGVPALLVGVEDPFSNAHSENESLNLSDFKKAVNSQIMFFAALSEVKGK